MFSHQQKENNMIESYDINMLLNDEIDCFDDCFTHDVTAIDTLDPYLMLNDCDAAAQRRLSMSSNITSNDRRFSLFGSYAGTEIETPKTPQNEYQECFEQFSTNNSNQLPRTTSAPLTHVPDLCDSSELEMDTSLDEEFEQKFQRSLSKLEESMRRSEQSRILLGGPTAVENARYNALHQSYSKGRSQIMSFMTQLGNNTM